MMGGVARTGRPDGNANSFFEPDIHLDTVRQGRKMREHRGIDTSVAVSSRHSITTRYRVEPVRNYLLSAISSSGTTGVSVRFV